MIPASTPAPYLAGDAAAPVGELVGRSVNEVGGSSVDGTMTVSVCVMPDVMFMSPDPVVVVALPLPLLLSVAVGVGGSIMMTLVPVPGLEDPGTGVGVCIGPPGCVKLSSPARKLEQTAWPAFIACPSSVGLVQLFRIQPPTFAAIALCVGPHWHAMSLS